MCLTGYPELLDFAFEADAWIFKDTLMAILTHKSAICYNYFSEGYHFNKMESIGFLKSRPTLLFFS